MQTELSLDFPMGILSKAQNYKSSDLRVKELSKSTQKDLQIFEKRCKEQRKFVKITAAHSNTGDKQYNLTKKNLPNLYRVFDYVIFIRTKMLVSN